MKSFAYTIKDETGIHARPAGQLCKLAKSFKSETVIEKNGNKVNASKLMMLMGLGVKYNDTVTVSVSGEDEEEAASKIEAFFRENL